MGPPDIIIIDTGTNFINKKFISNANAMVINIIKIPVEAHYLIDKVKRYYIIIRRVYNIILTKAKITPENTLQIIIKTINDTAGPNRLVLILLIFGVYPRIFSLSPLSLSVAERAKIIIKIIKEIR